MSYISNIVVGTCSNVLFIAFAVTVVGYLLGKIEIKGVGLGTAGVFLIALLFGHFGCADDSLLHSIGLITTSQESIETAMKLLQNIGLLCFVTSVGFIAGPNFFGNLKANAKSYVLLSFVIIGGGSLACLIIILCTKVDSAMAVGILSGALTTTPGFSAAQEAIGANEVLLNEVTVGHAVGYPFGVVGVVLFVQIIPKLLKVDYVEERKKINAGQEPRVRQALTGLLELDPIGLGAFSLAIILGILVGKISVPLPGGAAFSLGNTGGALLMGLILGHFGHIGPFDMEVSEGFLKSFREFGLVLFLIGAGVPGGSGFVKIVSEYGISLFIYGALMEIAAMVIGYIVATKVVKLCLFNSLGAITGGMTSTPALGALVNSAGTDDVASSYAATYPCSLVLIVILSQLLVTFF